MTDPIRTPAEALEAAAQIAAGKWPRGSAHTYASENADRYIALEDASEAIAAAIRSLASRIPPAPDDEALVEVVARALCVQAWDDPDRQIDVGIGVVVLWPAWRPYEQQARAVLSALREAGALR